MTSVAQQALRLLGPSPIGDPAAMRRHAATLEQVAAALEVQAAAVESSAIHGVGPFVDRVRLRVLQERDLLRECVRELRDLARQLLSVAGGVEHAQHDWRHRLARAEHEIADAIRRAGR